MGGESAHPARPGGPAVNPVLPGFFPDPSICRVGDRYYLANSTFEYFPGIPIHESDDLVDWRPIGSAIDRPAQLDLSAAGDSKGLYAPALSHHEGTFYLACALVGGPSDANFFVTATDPRGPWSDPVWVTEADGFDPSLVFVDGTAYWVATRVLRPGAYDGETLVWVRQVDLESGRLIGEETVIWRTALRDAIWGEGPHVFERDGWFYVLTAEGGTAGEHAVVIGRSRSLTGPYENCPRNPVLTHRHLGRDYPVQNVGHADFVEKADGSWAAVVLAVRKVDGHHILGRETFVADVVWEDGWPVVNPGSGILRDVGDRPLVVTEQAPRLDGFLSVRGRPGFASDVPAGIRMRSTGVPVSGAGAPAALLRRLQHHCAELEMTVGAVTGGARTGLILRQSGDYSIRAESDAAEIRFVVRDGGEDRIIAAHPRARGDLVVFAAHIEVDRVVLEVDGISSPPLSVDVLSTERAGGFVGTLWGVFVEGASGSEATLHGFRYVGGDGGETAASSRR